MSSKCLDISIVDVLKIASAFHELNSIDQSTHFFDGTTDIITVGVDDVV
jgi:hypothetical protein